MRSGLLAAVFALGALSGACYNPNIKSGALKCAAGRTCPDGFQCASDNLCYRGDGGPDVPATMVCNSVTPDASTCSRPAASGQPCNPACQSGCSCGWCGVKTTGAVACLMGTPGTKTTVGTLCDPTNPYDCAPGLYCRAECGTGRCYKFCDTGDDCAVGTSCSISLPSSALHLCSLPDPGCDPIRKTLCPSGFACYPSGTRTECDCPGTDDAGTTCGFTDSCMPGYQCVATSGTSTPTCQKLCRVSSDCGGTRTCVASGTTYSYCTP
jgi:hypothetical protein